MNFRNRPFFATLIAPALLIFSYPALAHHVMDGTLPSTLTQGLLSGFAHPIIGLDHLAFIVAVGLIAARQIHARRAALPIGFVVATAIGTGIHLLSIDVPVAELAIAISVVLLGAVLACHVKLAAGLALTLTALAGLFHGYAYGESIVGAETTPLVAYLAGFALIQAAIAYSAMLVAEKWLSNAAVQRVSGSVILAVGLFFLLPQIG